MRVLFKINNLKKLSKYFIITVLSFIIISIMWALLYKWYNPPLSTFMIYRNMQSDNSIFHKPNYKWLELSEISENIIVTVIASEDNNFFTHNGFEWKSIKDANKSNSSGKLIRGGSTISQQCSKNVFLWPHKHYIRKGLEVWFTFLIETIWGKERILEVYLNVIETGKGIYGVEKAANTYYKKSCKSVTRSEAAFIAAILPNPIKWKIINPGPYVTKRQKWILRNSKNIYPVVYPFIKD